MRHFSNFAIPHDSGPGDCHSSSGVEEAAVSLGCPACGFTLTRPFWCLKANDSIICDECGVTIELVKFHQASCALDNQMYEVAKTLQAMLADVRDDLEAELLGR